MITNDFSWRYDNSDKFISPQQRHQVVDKHSKMMWQKFLFLEVNIFLAINSQSAKDKLCSIKLKCCNWKESFQYVFLYSIIEMLLCWKVGCIQNENWLSLSSKLLSAELLMGEEFLLWPQAFSSKNVRCTQDILKSCRANESCIISNVFCSCVFRKHLKLSVCIIVYNSLAPKGLKWSQSWKHLGNKNPRIIYYPSPKKSVTV